MNTAQETKAIEVWNHYKATDKRFVNVNQYVSQNEIDTNRNNAIPIALEFLTNYISENLSLEAFKSEIDGFNKRNPFWGFRGINGQMFFNMLYNFSSGVGMVDKLDAILKSCLPMPVDIFEAKQKIELLTEFTITLGNYVVDRRSIPRTGSALFFISYFWQMQDCLKWPIYYKSMINVFQDLYFWHPQAEHSRDYEEFYNLNFELRSLYQTTEGQVVNLWDVEHAFWAWAGKVDEIVIEAITPTATETKKIDAVISGLPTSFIPPVVSVLPILARNEADIQKICEVSGISVEKAFEERISILFKMLDYQVEPLGQGYGRVPDGIAICQEFHYAIVYDAKVRQNGYSMGTDDRAIREYIMRQTERLKRQGIRNVYFAIISSSFNADYDDIIRTLKMETDIREILFIEVAGLLTILEQKLRNPDLDLGPKGIQSLLAQSGVLKQGDIKVFLGV